MHSSPMLTTAAGTKWTRSAHWNFAPAEAAKLPDTIKLDSTPWAWWNWTSLLVPLSV